MITGSWSYPTSIRFGPGRVRELPDACRELGMTRPLLVTDPGLAGHPMIAEAVERTSSRGVPTDLFHDLHPDPTGDDVERGVRAFLARGNDGVIAFGGGAALDAGKAIALMVGQERPIWDFEDRGDNWKRVRAEGMRPVVAVPTTAGTGSEVGRASVVLREDLHEKVIVFHPRMLPAIVLSDPELTISLPPHLTAATGLDAFTHCLEAFCAPGFHPFADGIAVEGMRLIARSLVRAYDDGTDLDARAEMLAAASMGATAFQKGLGAVHALSHPIGAVFGTHHGLTNAVLLPYVLAFNADVLREKASYLERVLALPGGLLEWVLALRERLGIPPTLASLGVPASEAERIGALAVRDPSAGGNPKPVTASDLARIFVAAAEGRLA